MKKLLILLSSSALLCSCGGGLSDRPMGMLYANVSDPVAVTSSSGSRTGVATATSPKTPARRRKSPSTS